MLTKRLIGQENVIYTHDGQVPCMCPQTGELHSMTDSGFELGSRNAQVAVRRATRGSPARAWRSAR